MAMAKEKPLRRIGSGRRFWFDVLTVAAGAAENPTPLIGKARLAPGSAGLFAFCS